MDALKAPFSAPTSSFVLDDEAAEECRGHLLPTATTATDQQTAAVSLSQAPLQTPAAVPSSQWNSLHAQQQVRQARPTAVAPTHAAPPARTPQKDEEQHVPASPSTSSSSASSSGAAEVPAAVSASSPPAAAVDGGGDGGSRVGPKPAPLQQLQQPAIVDVLGQLATNAADIRAAEEALQALLTKQHSLRLLVRKLEQQRVITAVLQPLGFHHGRPVAALLLLRCFQQWGVLTADSAPVLDQLACVLQQQLSLEDESAPAEVAGLQCHVAYWLTVSAVLLCLLLKTTNPQLAAAAAAQNRAGSSRHVAAEVMTAARRRVGELQQQLAERVSHMGGLQGGLHALGKRFKGWGLGAAQQQQQQQQLESGSSGNAAADEGSSSSSLEAATGGNDGSGSQHAACSDVHGHAATPAAVPAAAAAAAAGSRSPASLQMLMLCLDSLVQRSFAMLRDQLKRRLAPLLSDCMVHPGLTAGPDSLGPSGPLPGPGYGVGATGGVGQLVGSSSGSGCSSTLCSGQATPGSPPPGAAVAGTAAASAAEAEAALLCYRSWSEVVGVMHAAVVALRGAGVPRALTAALVQQVLQFINCQLFNQLLLRPECCSAGNARYVLRGLKQLDGWILAEHSASAACEGDADEAAMACGVRGAAGAGRSGSDAAAGGSGGAAAASGGSGGCGTQQQAGPQQKAPALGVGAAAAAAAAAAGEDADAGWEQVPADTGEFDVWQPLKQQQQQEGRVRLWQWQMQAQEQQQQQHGPPVQHDIGPEAWHALSHIRQALQFLVLDHKGALSLEELSGQVCPALSHQQLYRLCTTAWDEAPGADRCVSGEALEQMKQRHALSTNGGLIVTYLLDEPAMLPFVQPAPAAAAASSAAPAAAVAGDGLFTGASVAAGGSGSGWRCKPSAVVQWDDGRDYGDGMPVPGVLVDGGCPAAVFAFLEQQRPWVQY